MKRPRRKRRKASKAPIYVCLAVFLLVFVVLALGAVLRVDTVPPVITLTGDVTASVFPGQNYVEEGFIATDNRDGDITANVVRTVTDDVIIYTVSDSAGNVTEVRRALRYEDLAAPVLNLTGGEQYYHVIGTAFTEPGFAAIDNGIHDVTDQVIVSGTMDIYTPGTYTMTYTVSDTSGNTATVTRSVIIEAIKLPETVNPGDKVVYLTFDDGPSAYTDRLLDILAKYNVKATFFVTNQKPAYASVMTRIVEEGHSIGVHSLTHVYSDIYSSRDRFFADFNAIRQLIYDYTGQWTTLSRFPGGSGGRVSIKYCPGLMTEVAQNLTDMGIQYFDWNIVSGDDGTYKDANSIFNAVISGIKKNNVSCVLQHDITSYSVEAVAQIIQWGLANGYTFLSMDSTSPTFHQTIRN